MDDNMSVKSYYEGKNIFLTGGSGFIGKALIEKLLRSCPKIGNIYVLLRPKKSQSIQERLDKIITDPLFEKLKETHPDNIKKIVPIKGDAIELGLGLSEEDRRLLIEEVNIFYHAAASVKFDDFLKYAIFINVRCTREAALLALEMKKIDVFMQISTTFCQIDKKVVKEIFYPSYGNWKDAINDAEHCDTQTFNILSQKYIEPFPNTYCFTKLLAENCVNDLLVGKIPAAICRLSVVVSTLKEPFQGWIDNLNGPVGLLLAGGCGILRTVYGNVQCGTDYMAVDNTVKIIILGTWHKSIFSDKNTMSIYHASKYDLFEFHQGDQVELGKQLYWDVPFEKKIWFPGNTMTKCWINYYMNVILFHLIPAIILDLLLRVAGYAPMIFKIQRKIYIANMAISVFMLNEWQFINVETRKLLGLISRQELEEFDFCAMPSNDRELYRYYMSSTDYGRRYLLKEYKDVTEETRIKTKRMYYLDRTMKCIFIGVTIWLIFFKIDVISVLWKMLCHYWDNL